MPLRSPTRRSWLCFAALAQAADETISVRDPIRPPLKWLGGKLRHLDTITAHFPHTARRYIEPFAGGAAVALNVPYEHCIVSDVNLPLWHFWTQLQAFPDDLIAEAESLFVRENNVPDRYYVLREEFNTSDDPLRRSALLLYLNRHGWRGRSSMNQLGGYNVPYGNETSPLFPKRSLREAANRISEFTILNTDFRRVIDMAGAGDVIYCDPPYLRHATGEAWAGYTRGAFTVEDHHDLAAMALAATRRGATVVTSNHLTQETLDLYRHADEHHQFTVRRTVSRHGGRREAISEILAVYRPA